MTREGAVDEARALYRSADRYARVLASFGLDGEVERKDASCIYFASVGALVKERETERELAAYARALGHPRDVVVDVPSVPRWDPMTAPCPVWLRDEMRMSLT